MSEASTLTALDAENRISSVNGGINYTYGANGERVRKVSGATYDYITDLSGRTITELSGGSATRIEVFAGGRHLATYAGGESGTTYFSHPDWLGTERVRSTVTGPACETVTSVAFGDQMTTAGSCGDTSPLHFTGKQRDVETGLDDFPARYYSSIQGRWMTPDWSVTPEPVPYAKLGDPQTLNLYAYVGNSPVTDADADGHLFNYYPQPDAGLDPYGNPVADDKKPEAAQNNHTVTITEVQGQQGNPANHIVVSVDGRPQVGFGPAKHLTKKQIAKEAMGIDKTGTPGKVEPRAAGVKTLDQVTVHVTADQATHAQTVIDQRSNSPGNYHLTTRNCAEFGEDVLKAGGVSAPTAAVPGELMMELHVEQSLGVVPQ